MLVYVVGMLFFMFIVLFLMDAIFVWDYSVLGGALFVPSLCANLVLGLARCRPVSGPM